MKKSIFFSAMVIVLVLAFTAVATFAYFSATKDETATITTARVGIGATDGFPLEFTNLLPGESQTQQFAITVGGNKPVDLYFQMIGTWEGKNFCIPDKVLNLKVEDLAGNVYWDGSICPLYPGQSEDTEKPTGLPDFIYPVSQIAPLGSNVADGATKKYKATITLASTAGNDYMGASKKDYIHLIAVQTGAPKPKPDRQGFAYGPLFSDWDAWPKDTHGPDDDLNYP